MSSQTTRKPSSYTVIWSSATDNHGMAIAGGRYMSNTPAVAARKAASKIFQKIAEKGGRARTLKVYIQETTRGSGNDMYMFTAKKVPKAKPVTVQFNNGQEIKYYYDILVEPESKSS